MRVTVFQPALPHYRIPVFAELATRPGIDLHVLFASHPEIPNATPDGFKASEVTTRSLAVGRHRFIFSPDQVAHANRSASDVILMGWDAHHISLFPALLQARRHGVGTLLWGHGFSRLANRIGPTVRHLLAKRADALLVYNQQAARSLRERDPNPDRVFVAPNSLDQRAIRSAARLWQSDPARLHRFAEAQGLLGKDTVLFCSRITPQRRLETLLHAVKIVKRTLPRIAAVVIGDGPAQTARLRSLAKDLGVFPNILFPGPLYDELQLAPFFLVSRAFVYPAKIGLSILHAFGYGLPVITSDDAAAHAPEFEAFRQGENGLLFADGEPEDLAAKIRYLLQNPDTSRLMGQRGLRRVETCFTTEKMVDGMVSAIEFSFRRPRSGR